MNLGNAQFDNLIALGDKKDRKASTYFCDFYSRGLSSARDAWCYQSHISKLLSNLEALVGFYNEQRHSYKVALSQYPGMDVDLDTILEFDSTKITWNRSLKQELVRDTEIAIDPNNVRLSLYRPFYKQSLYFARELNDMVYQIPKLFPTPEQDNRVICVSGVGASKSFSTLMTDCIPDIQLQFNGQCFPLYYYEVQEQSAQTSLWERQSENGYTRRDGITDFILGRARQQYGKSVTKEDIFYYVYGILHSPAYRKTFANDLKKSLPRLPLVERVKDFWAFSKAGRELAELHIHYESVPPYSGVTVTGAEGNFFHVEKMRFPKKDGKVRGKERKVDDKSTIHYNGMITITDIPKKAYKYVVNGKSAIEWIMDRYQISTHAASGIVNDPNDWAAEVGNPRYILDLLLSVINVSVKTVDIVEGLPKLEFE